MTAVLCFVPAYKNQLTGSTLLATHALAAAFHNRGISWGISSISNPDIEWVRNWAITHWYDKLTQYSHLLFVDDDMAFMPDVVLDMLTFGEPVVGALYPKKTIDRQWAVSGIPTPQQRGPFIEVEGLGCGCFLIRRDAITAMIEKMPQIIDTRVNTIDSALFREAGVTRMIRAFDCINDVARGKVSEDISFGRRWRECGGQVWAATHHKIVHVGPFEFADQYSTWAQTVKAERAAAVQRKLAEAPILADNSVLRGKACKHGAFIYNPNDTFIGRSLEAYGEWSEFEIELLRRFVREGDTVIDVGANIGTHTMAFSRMVGKSGRVFAFEAQPRLEKILEANIRLNDLGNVIWDCKAVGSECCGINVPDIPEDTTECNFGNFSLQHISDHGTAGEMITIDSFAADGDAFGASPVLIKIDVEGMEVDVIYGAMGTIERCRPVIYLDYGERENGHEVWVALEAIGYKAYWSMGPFFNPLNSFGNSVNIWPAQRVLAANLICVHKSCDYPELASLPPYLGERDNWRMALERLAGAHRQAAE